MAFLIFGLIGLFLVGCLFYGIYSGVGAIVRGTNRSPAALWQSPRPSKLAIPADVLRASPHLFPVDELKALFELHQKGALTREEFELMKKHIVSDASHSHGK